ncbi:Signal transduction histidine kinase [Nocardiopsis flavescens]|uniref:histidine kinase n=1 Tax=Nocardiopsis flavescens TaxID=758803 RepID=A0A1M6VQF1_9ACTN|nr:histidine kinase [Nocardiopsis flavescens]SHK83561.1 Signal transduction histidine kinase [Nocardiopsis flavescens]
MTESETGAPASAAPGAGALLRRPWVRAALVSVLCSLLGPPFFLVSLGLYLDSDPRDHGALLAFALLDVPIGLAAGIAAGPLRRSTAGNLVLVLAGSVSSWALPACAVATVRLGARRSHPLAGLVLLLTVGSGTAFARLHSRLTGIASEPLLFEVLAVGALTLFLLLWGYALGTREALVATLRERAEAAERERVATVRGRNADIARTRAEERNAIARDMHDGLSHQLAIIAMHAGALAYRSDLPPDRMREAAGTVRDAAADANGVLREVLSALRAVGPGAPSRSGTEPLPTPASLGELVEGARAAGQRVDVRWRGLDPGDLGSLAPTTAVSLARVTSELLMNARKHAPGEPVELVFAREGDALTVRAANAVVDGASPAQGTGLGLVGVAERAQLLGGTARYGGVGGRFEVEVRVPWRL